MVPNCNICNGEVDITKGGCSIMMAFCHYHTTNLSNLSFCASCYKTLLDKPMRAFAYAACLEIQFDEDDENAEAEVNT